MAKEEAQLNIKLSQELHQKVSILAGVRRIAMGEVARLALEAYLEDAKEEQLEAFSDLYGEAS